jgi:TolB-like protein
VADRVALAVLPFKNLSGDPSQEYFSDGLTEEMITQLSTVNPRGLGVLARTSAMRYKDTRKGADEIGKELHVDFLVEGSVRRENQRVRISAQLVRASDQIHVWAKSYERDLREILVLQREVARDIAQEINVSVSPSAPARARPGGVESRCLRSLHQGATFLEQADEGGSPEGDRVLPIRHSRRAGVRRRVRWAGGRLDFAGLVRLRVAEGSVPSR